MDVYMKFSLLALFLITTQVWAGFSVSTYNIRNFNKDPGAGTTNVAELTKIIQSVKSDVMGFEEVVNVAAFKSLMQTALPGYLFEISACGGGGKQHLAIAYNPKTFKFINTAEDATFSGSTSNSCGSLRPMFMVNLEHKATKTFYLFSANHLKAGGDANAFNQRWNQYKKLLAFAEASSELNLIMLGDFNTTGYNIKNEDYTKFEEFLTNAKLRTMSENLGCTSYWEGELGGAEHQSSILDHIILQEKNAAAVQEINLGSHCAKSACKPSTPADLGVSYQSVSDHCPVQIIFK
jgi:endonuclease/exonuclease/phosphatase family metal-dependent hydrolase